MRTDVQRAREVFGAVRAGHCGRAGAHNAARREGGVSVDRRHHQEHAPLSHPHLPVRIQGRELYSSCLPCRWESLWSWTDLIFLNKR
jgi:hypothetical protein